MEVKKGGLEEDHQSSSLKEKIVNRKKPIHLFILNGIDAFFVFGFVKVFGILAYDRKFLSGKQFEHFWSPGWRWAFNGMIRKLLTGPRPWDSVGLSADHAIAVEMLTFTLMI